MGIDTGTTMSDTTAVTVTHDEDEQDETWAEVADAAVTATVSDPACLVDVHRESTGCIVILSQL